jgi:type I restriction enzyme S subunit
MPEDWEAFQFGELFEFSNGVNADKSAYGDGIPFANVFEIIKNEALIDELIPGRIRLSPALVARHLVRHGDVLFNRSSETSEEVGLASVYLGHSKITFGGFVFRARPKTNQLDIQYSKYALRAHKVREQIVARGQGAIRANVGQRDLKSVRIWLPQLNEQRSTARALVDVDELIATLERAIMKKQQIKQGMMQQLLTGKVRLPDFGADWSTLTLGDMGSFLKGRGIRRDDVRGSGVPCIRYGELYTTFRDYTFTSKSYVDPNVAVTALPIRSGDLLFAGSGETREEIGMCVAYAGQGAAVAGGDIVVLRGTEFNPIYLALLANTPAVARQKSRLGQGDAVVHISSRALATIKVTVPQKDEQDAIAKVIMDADREIEALRLRLSKAKGIKQGMMQELLTGRTRLPVHEEGQA